MTEYYFIELKNNVFQKNISFIVGNKGTSEKFIAQYTPKFISIINDIDMNDQLQIENWKYIKKNYYNMFFPTPSSFEN